MVFASMIIVLTIGFRQMESLLEKYLDTKNKEIQQKEYELYNNLDIDKSKAILNKMVDDYIAEYSLYNFTAHDKDYIGQKDADLLIKEVTKTISLNISNYYLFLLKTQRSIDNVEDLVLAIRDIVKERTLIYITEFNKPN
jgi:hypothetical protein